MAFDKRAWQREYMRGHRARANQAKKALEQVIEGQGGVPATLDEPAKQALRVLLRSHSLTVDQLLGKLAKLKEAQRPWGDHENPIMADDNDAQLKALDIGLRLNERTNDLPSDRTVSHGGNLMVIQAVNYYANALDITPPSAKSRGNGEITQQQGTSMIVDGMVDDARGENG